MHTYNIVLWISFNNLDPFIKKFRNNVVLFPHRENEVVIKNSFFNYKKKRLQTGLQLRKPKEKNLQSIFVKNKRQSEGNNIILKA